MSMTPCPGCGMPRLADDVGRTPCPICGPAADPEPIALSPDPPDARAVARRARRPRSVRGVVVPAVTGAVGFAAGAAAVLGWQHFGPTPTPVAPDPEAVAVAPPAADPPKPSPSPAPSPQPATSPTKPTPPKPGVPDPPPTPIRTNRGVVHLTQPDGVYVTPELRSGETLTLRGKVKALHVPRLDGQATLDATELDAAEVVFLGDVTGEATAKVKAPDGAVTFRGRVAGGATVAVAGKAVTFGTVTGTGTRASVVLSQGGSLVFAEIGDRAEVEYRRAKPWDASPRVVGKVQPGAVLKGDE